MLRLTSLVCIFACVFADSYPKGGFYPKNDYYGGCGKYGCTYGVHSQGPYGNFGGIVSSTGGGLDTGFVSTGGLNTGLFGLGGGSAAASAAAAGDAPAAASAAAAGQSAAASAAAAAANGAAASSAAAANGGLGWNIAPYYYNQQGNFYNFPGQHGNFGQYLTYPGNFYNSYPIYNNYAPYYGLGGGLSAAASASAVGGSSAASAGASSVGGFGGFNGIYDGIFLGGSRRSFRRRHSKVY